jgi:hypothetical protein
MKTCWLVPVLFAAGISIAVTGCGTIPRELVGEWATPESKFQNDALSKGEAVYICTNGRVLIMGAPPPIGTEGKASYHDSRHLLSIFVEANPNEGLDVPIKARLVYDPQAKTLTGGVGTDEKSVFTRRRDFVPRGLIEDAKP